jgi:Tol biopolymer transport system component
LARRRKGVTVPVVIVRRNDMQTRRLPFALTAAALACAALAAGLPPADKALAGKPAPAFSNPAVLFTSSGSLAIVIAKMDGTCKQLTTPPNKGGDYGATWSPNGTQIAFLRVADASKMASALWIMNADGSNQRCVIPAQNWTAGALYPTQLHWSSDGQFLMCGGYVVDMKYGQFELLSDFFGNLPGVKFHAVDVSFGHDLDPDTAGFQGYLVCDAYWDNADGTTDGHSLVLLEADMFNDASGMQIDLALGAVSEEKDYIPEWPGISGTHCCPVLSPDGTMVAFRNGQGSLGCYLKVMDIGTDIAGNPVFGPSRILWDYGKSPYPHVENYDYGILGTPAWSPDGACIAFVAQSGPNASIPLFDVFRIGPDGSGFSPITSVSDKIGVKGFGAAWNPAWDPSKP